MFDPNAKTVTITLLIIKGFALNKLDNLDENQILSDGRNDKNSIRVLFDLPISCSLEDFKIEMFERIYRKWEVDVKACKKENGGKGAMGSLTCGIDVSGKKDKHQITRMSIPNEESWDAAKYLMKSAQGEIEVTFIFAVESARTLERWALKYALGPLP